MSDVWVVIPVHNRAPFTEACLIALDKQDFSDFEVVVVDDGSSDATPEMLARRAGIHVVRGDGSWWWSKSTNAGVAYAIERGAKWVMTLNDDTLPPPSFVRSLQTHAKRNPRALIGALETDAGSGEVIYWGETVDWLRAQFKPISPAPSPEERSGLHSVTHFPGRGLIIPVEAFADVGLYDAGHFPQAVADYDFTHRAFRAGFPIYCAWDVELPIFPMESGGVRLKETYSLRNYWLHLFGVRGAGNLRTFLIYAVKNCPRSRLVPFVVLGVARRVVGYARDWIRELWVSRGLE